MQTSIVVVCFASQPGATFETFDTSRFEREVARPMHLLIADSSMVHRIVAIIPAHHNAEWGEYVHRISNSSIEPKLTTPSERAIVRLQSSLNVAEEKVVPFVSLRDDMRKAYWDGVKFAAQYKKVLAAFDHEIGVPTIEEVRAQAWRVARELQGFERISP